MRQNVTRARILEGSAVVLLARVLDAAGELLTQALTQSIALTVTDCDTGSKVNAAPAALAKADVVHDELQTDARWSIDSTGYNFAAVLDGAACFPDGGTTYRAEVMITPTSGPAFYLVYELTTEDLRGQ